MPGHIVEKWGRLWLNDWTHSGCRGSRRYPLDLVFLSPHAVHHPGSHAPIHPGAGTVGHPGTASWAHPNLETRFWNPALEQ